MANSETQQAVLTAVLNNHGVDYLRAGDFDRAVVLFRNALEGTLTGCGLISEDDAASDDRENSDDLLYGNNITYATYWKCPQTFARHIAPLTRISVRSNSSIFQYLHCQALYILPVKNAYVTSDSLANTAVVASIILYNLALLFHLKGLEGNNDVSEARLNNACSLYARSRTLLEETLVSTRTSSGCVIIDYLCMAVLNNFGFVAHQLEDYDGSIRHYDELVQFTVSMALEPSYQQRSDAARNAAREEVLLFVDAETKNILEESRTNFLLNAFSLRRPNLAPAA